MFTRCLPNLLLIQTMAKNNSVILEKRRQLFCYVITIFLHLFSILVTMDLNKNLQGSPNVFPTLVAEFGTDGNHGLRIKATITSSAGPETNENRCGISLLKTLLIVAESFPFCSPSEVLLLCTLVCDCSVYRFKFWALVFVAFCMKRHYE